MRESTWLSPTTCNRKERREHALVLRVWAPHFCRLPMLLVLLEMLFMAPVSFFPQERNWSQCCPQTLAVVLCFCEVFLCLFVCWFLLLFHCCCFNFSWQCGFFGGSRRRAQLLTSPWPKDGPPSFGKVCHPQPRTQLWKGSTWRGEEGRGHRA